MLGERMEREIAEQPELLARNAPIYAEKFREMLQDVKPEMILLAARGSSDHAALYARYLIEIHLAIPVVLAAPSVLTRYGTRVKYPPCLAIGISQSGAAPDVAEVIESVGVDHPTLGITNTPGSHLTEAAKHVLLLEVGKEESVAATKTYTASLMALLQVVRNLQGWPTGMSAVPVPDSTWLHECQKRADVNATAVVEGDAVFVLGRGYGFATASESALKLMECALIPAKAYSSADFEHGPKALAGPGSVVIAYEPIPSKLQDQGATVIEASQPSDNVPEELWPIWQAFYAQWLALACARTKGLNPDKPQFLHKITRTT